MVTVPQLVHTAAGDYPVAGATDISGASLPAPADVWVSFNLTNIPTIPAGSVVVLTVSVNAPGLGPTLVAMQLGAYSGYFRVAWANHVELDYKLAYVQFDTDHTQTNGPVATGSYTPSVNLSAPSAPSAPGPIITSYPVIAAPPGMVSSGGHLIPKTLYLTALGVKQALFWNGFSWVATLTIGTQTGVSVVLSYDGGSDNWALTLGATPLGPQTVAWTILLTFTNVDMTGYGGGATATLTVTS